MPYTQITTNWKDFLASGSLTIACCLRIVRADTTVIAITSHQHALVVPSLTFGSITIPGTTYLASPPFIPKNIESSEDIGEFDNWEIETSFGNGITEADVSADAYDQATWSLLLVNYADLSTGMGGQLYKRGTIQNATVHGQKLTMELASLTYKFQQFIIDQVQPTCRNQFGLNDGGATSFCGFNLSSTIPSGPDSGKAATVATTVTSVSDNQHFLCSAVSSYSANRFFKGLAKFTSGPNNGQIIEIQSSTSGNMVLREPPDFDITPGDSVMLVIGCNKVLSTCVAYNQAINFGGEDGVPTIIQAGQVHAS